MSLRPSLERFDDRAREALRLVRVEAIRLDLGYLGTEHVLLGLLREDDAIALQILANLGVTPDAIRGAVLARLGSR